MIHLTLSGMIEKLKNFDTVVNININVTPFWKRSFEYTCDNRVLNQQEISLVLKGKMQGEIAGKSIIVEAGELMWMSSNIPHTLTWEKELIYFTFRFSILSESQEVNFSTPFIKLTNAVDLEPIFRNIVYTLHDSSENKHRKDQLQAYFLLLFTNISNQLERSDKQQCNVREFSESEKKSIYNYLINNDLKDVNPDTLSSCIGLSHDYFSRIFNNTFGKSVRMWIYQEKMHFAARQLVDSKLTVKELADMLGYEDVYQFSRQFKKVTGLSPKYYRNQNYKIQTLEG